MRIHALILAAVSSAFIAAAAPAFAQEFAPTARVSLAGLDLSSQTGAAMAVARIRTGADQVCGERPDLFPLARMNAYDTCRKAAIEGAVKGLHQPLVSRAANLEIAPQVLASR